MNVRELIRFFKFLLVSVSAGILQMGSFALLNELLHLNYWVSYLVSLTLSVVWNLTVNRKVTFHSTANIPAALAKILAYYAVFTPATTLLGSWLVDTVGWNEYLVTALNMVLNFATEFLYQRFVVFRGSIDSATPNKDS